MAKQPPDDPLRQTALEKVGDLVPHTCTIVRDGYNRDRFPARRLVLGDLIVLATGDCVPAKVLPRGQHRPPHGRELAHWGARPRVQAGRGTDRAGGVRGGDIPSAHGAGEFGRVVDLMGRKLGGLGGLVM